MKMRKCCASWVDVHEQAFDRRAEGSEVFWSVECPYCCAVTAWSDSHQRALDAWNTKELATGKTELICNSEDGDE